MAIGIVGILLAGGLFVASQKNNETYKSIVSFSFFEGDKKQASKPSDPSK